MERLLKPSVVCEGEPGNNSPDPTALPDTEHSDIIGGSANETTPSAHVIMAVIAPWTEPFLTYLTRQELPEDQNEARCIVWQSKAYKAHEGELYKKSTTGVLQRCISEEEGRNLLAEVHAGLGGCSSVPCKQGLPYRLLLADGSGRRPGLSPTMRRLPAFCKPKPYATHSPPNYPHHLARRGLGA